MSPRLILAAEAGAFDVALPSRILLLDPPLDLDLSLFGKAAVSILTDMMPDFMIWQKRKVTVIQDTNAQAYDVAVVFAPRIKALAFNRLALAARVADRVIVDGQKTDGIESLHKDIKKRAPLQGPISKAHGKLFWFDGGVDFGDAVTAPAVREDRWHVAPGVFSFDGIDPGSHMLAAAIPSTLSGRVADLGAGWGYLSAIVLERCPKIKALHLIEAHAPALECAKQNVTDPRALFHWADATRWAEESKLDAIIMNPPFHKGRAADTDLGRAFVASAARLLRPGGHLWMVANRHLAYEQVLRERFANVTEAGGDNRYKLIQARAAR